MPRVVAEAAADSCALEVSADPARMDLDGGWAHLDLPDELATKISIEFYADPKDAFLKGLVE